MFNPFITSYNFASRDKELTIDEFNAELLSYEALIDSQCVYLASNTTHFALTTSKQKPSLSQEKRSLPCKQLDPHRTLGKLVPPMSRRTHKRQGQIRDNMPQEITSNVKYMWENWSYSSWLVLQIWLIIPRPTSSYRACSNGGWIQCYLWHQVWYADSGANAHITSEAKTLTLQQPITGQDTDCR